MTNEKRTLDGEYTVSEYIEGFIEEIRDGISDELVGLWDIVRSGRYRFGFAGTELHSFISESIKALISNGAMPTTKSADPLYMRMATERFGVTPDEIAKAVVKEWIDQGEPDIDDWTGVCFATKQYLLSLDNIKIKK